MSPERKQIVQNLLVITGIGLGFGLLYNYLFYPHTLTEFLEAGSISLILSLVVGLLEQFVVTKTVRNMPFLAAAALRALVYSLLVSITLSLVLSIEIAMVEAISYTEALLQYLTGPLFQRDFVFSFLFVIFMLFGLQIVLLVGKANFVRLMLGLYHKPREIPRIFLFVDLRDSTKIAERLTNKAFSALIRDFYNDLSDAIMLFGGEVYQYVGDEVVIVWPMGKKASNSALCFFKMQEIIERRRNTYQSKYGLVPEFKGAIHGGEVVVTAVGKQKREIAYHGDVLNTTSRIEGKCNELGQSLLISEDMLPYLDLGDKLTVEKKGEIELRGKAERLTLYGVSRRSV